MYSFVIHAYCTIVVLIDGCHIIELLLPYKNCAYMYVRNHYTVIFISLL